MGISSWVTLLCVSKNPQIQGAGSPPSPSGHTAGEGWLRAPCPAGNTTGTLLPAIAPAWEPSLAEKNPSELKISPEQGQLFPGEATGHPWVP